MDFVYFLGRFHVLALHLPIGIIVVLFVLEYLSRKERFRYLEAASPYLWGATAISALVTVHVVLPEPDRLKGLGYEGSVLWDSDADLESRYGAVAECAYLIRPDLYVAYRAMPLDEQKLWAFLGKTFFAAV